MQELNKHILEKALEAGICLDWAKKISDSAGRDELLTMYVKGIDFCLEKEFPSNEDLLKFGGDDLVKYGIYVNGQADQSREFVVLLGASSGNIIIDGYSVSQIFIKHQSKALVAVKDHSFVVIDVFDNSALSVKASGNSKTLINVYGNAVVSHTAIDNASVKIVQKNKATY